MAKHIHKYIRVQLKHVKVWRCALAECNHFMPPPMENLVIGRASLCWTCGDKFVMSESSMTEDMPRCDPCRFPAILDVEDLLKGRLKDE